MKYTRPSWPSRPSEGAGGGVNDQVTWSVRLSRGTSGRASGIVITVPSTAYSPADGGRSGAASGMAGLESGAARSGLPFSAPRLGAMPPGIGTPRRKDVLPQVHRQDGEGVGRVVDVYHRLLTGEAVVRRVEHGPDGVARVLDPVPRTGYSGAGAGAPGHGAAEGRGLVHRSGDRPWTGRGGRGIQGRPWTALCAGANRRDRKQQPGSQQEAPKPGH